jgi:hypothetical protein
VVTSGDVTLVLWAAIPDSLARLMALRSDSILARAGVVPSSFIRGVILVMRDAADTAAVLAAAGLADRRRLELNIAPPLTQLDDWWVLGAVVAAYSASLDSAWAEWAQHAWGFIRWPDRMAERGGRELLAPAWSVADRCLAGEALGCRLYLGLDRDTHPYRARFTAAERRRMVEGYWGGHRGMVECRQGDDDACASVLEHAPFTGTAGNPSSGDTRAGLLAAVAALHGPEVLRAALEDRTGSIGERLARATGISVDSLVLEWRAWALSGGSPYHVRAGIADVAAAALTVALLLYLATRSRPWT